MELTKEGGGALEEEGSYCGNVGARREAGRIPVGRDCSCSLIRIGSRMFRQYYAGTEVITFGNIVTSPLATQGPRPGIRF